MNLTPQDVLSAFAGMRPLVKSKDAVNTKELIRDHEVEVDDASGLVSVSAANGPRIERWPKTASIMRNGPSPASKPRARRWISAYRRGRILDGLLEAVSREYHLPTETARHLAQKFGTDSPKVLELAKDEPQLCNRSSSGAPILAGGRLCHSGGDGADVSKTFSCAESECSSIAGRKLQSRARRRPLLAREFGWSDAQTRRCSSSRILGFDPAPAP